MIRNNPSRHVLNRILSYLLFLFLLTGNAFAERVSVFGTVPPISAIVAAVGGEHVSVHSLLRPGDNPVTFSPTPHQLAQLADSQLLAVAGLPFEHAWLPRIRSLSDGLEILDLRRGLNLMDRPHHHDNFGADGETAESDPHIWTDPLMVIQMSETVRQRLSRLDPENSEYYRTRQRQLADRLHGLHMEIQAALNKLQHRHFLVFHPAWGYFARRYGLEQMAIEHEGKQGGSRWIVELIERARKKGIKVILVQPQFDHRLAQQIAGAIGGRILSVDPLAYDFEDSLRKLAEAISRGDR